MNFGRHTFAIIVLMLHLLIGLLIHSDYGISWDEEYQHDYGRVVSEYVFDGNEALLEHNSRYHGPAIQFLLFLAEDVSGVTDSREVFILRHLLTFLLAVLGCGFFYLLLLQFGFKPYWAALGMLLLICSPRIFAHSFFNSKDAVFMHLFVIGIYTMTRFLKRPTWKMALLHGLVCGFLTDVRILGAFVPIFTGGFWLMKVAEDRALLQRWVLPMMLFGAVTLMAVFAFWPTLWHAPLTEFQNAVAKMGDYPWDDPILFGGRFQLPQELPWYYLPKWMLISTPIFVSAFMVVGLFVWMMDHRQTVSEKLTPLLWVLLPFGMIIWKDATVYDGWRHVFFLYPALLIMAVSGAEMLFGKLVRFRWAKFIPLGLLLVPMAFMVRSHPNQQVYFNPLVRENAFLNYEMDYWGLSYRQALEWLVENNSQDELNITIANAPGFYNHWMLTPEDRARIRYVSRDSADHFISNFRFPIDHGAFVNGTAPYEEPEHIIEVQGNPTVGVFRLRRP